MKGWLGDADVSEDLPSPCFTTQPSNSYQDRNTEIDYFMVNVIRKKSILSLRGIN